MRNAALSARLRTGRRMTALTTPPQKRLSAPVPCSAPRPMIGILSALIRSPSRLSTAGSSVSAAATEVMPTRIAPAARLRKIVLGMSSRPSIAITKAKPLKSTARLAVAPVAAIASSFSRPPERSSRKRDTTNRA